MRINQINSDYNIANKGFNFAKKNINPNKKGVSERIKQNVSNPPNLPGTFGEKLQRYAKKISDAMLKILDIL